jgi:hypothetical protein
MIGDHTPHTAGSIVEGTIERPTSRLIPSHVLTRPSACLSRIVPANWLTFRARRNCHSLLNHITNKTTHPASHTIVSTQKNSPWLPGEALTLAAWPNCEIGAVN